MRAAGSPPWKIGTRRVQADRGLRAGTGKPAVRAADLVDIGRPLTTPERVGSRAGLGDAHVIAGGRGLAGDRDQVGVVGERDPHRLLGVAGSGGSGGGGASCPGAWPITWR